MEEAGLGRDSTSNQQKQQTKTSSKSGEDQKGHRHNRVNGMVIYSNNSLNDDQEKYMNKMVEMAGQLVEQMMSDKTRN